MYINTECASNIKVHIDFICFRSRSNPRSNGEICQKYMLRPYTGCFRKLVPTLNDYISHMDKDLYKNQISK